MADYANLWDEARRTGDKVFFADEAHFRADAELRGKWVLRGEPAPRFHGAGSGGLEQPAAWRKASYYSAVALHNESFLIGIHCAE